MVRTLFLGGNGQNRERLGTPPQRSPSEFTLGRRAAKCPWCFEQNLEAGLERPDGTGNGMKSARGNSREPPSKSPSGLWLVTRERNACMPSHLTVVKESAVASYRKTPDPGRLKLGRCR